MRELLSRREFLGKAKNFAIVAAGPLAQPLANEALVNLWERERFSLQPGSFVGVNNLHMINPNNFPPHTPLRVPLNRRAFELDKEVPLVMSLRQRCVFYLESGKILDLRQRGTRVMLVIEMSSKDDVKHLRWMVDNANGFLGLKKGDRIAMGNEYNDDGQEYPPEIYVEQLSSLYQYIKDKSPEIEVGLRAEAWREGKNFEALLENFSRGSFPFNFVPLNYYGRPQDLPVWVGRYRESMNHYGLNLPIVLSEVGVRVSDSPESEKRRHEGEIIATPEQQKNTVWKYLCFAKACGVESVFWFCAQDFFDGQWQNFGLEDRTGKKRPALDELRRAQAIIDKIEEVHWQKIGDLYIFTLKRKEFIIEVSWICPENDDLGGPVTVETTFLTHPRKAT